MIDVTPFIAPKSDQLNADNLMGGPITVQITGASKGSAEQPVVLRLAGGHMPYKPCKTMLRLMVAAWGTTDASQWVGRWLTLYRDPNVNSPDGTKNAGGIRIAALSHIDGKRTFALTEKKGSKKAWKIDPIRAAQQESAGAPTADLAAFMAEASINAEAVDRWRAGKGKPSISSLSDDARAQFAGWLGANATALAEIVAMSAAPPATDPQPDTLPPVVPEPDDADL